MVLGRAQVERRKKYASFCASHNVLAGMSDVPGINERTYDEV